MLRNFLQGKWLGHPLHPLLVHLPIGLFVLAFVCDALSFWLDWPHLVPVAHYAIGLGVATGLLAAIPGLADFTEIRRDTESKRTARTHMILNVVSLLLYGVSFIGRYGNLDAERTPTGPFLFALAGLAILSYSGYLGGMLVYDDGVGAGRHRRQTRLPKETVVRTGAPGEFFQIGRADDLAPGETIRAEINGAAIAIVNADGTFYAFQEFCPHRYGPLSEGAFIDGQVECPWHRSCFDIRTGKVTSGPAKIDLKTFPVRVRDGNIEVAEGESAAEEEKGKR